MPHPSFASDIAPYVAQARRAPVLDADQEAALARRWKDHGDRGAGDLLVRAYARTLIPLALRFRRYGVPVPELIAEGNLGVVIALRKFDPDRGVRFSTYASYWARAQMLSYVMRNHSVISGNRGATRGRYYFRLRRERARALSRLGDGEQVEREIATVLGLPIEKVRALLQELDCRGVSLDAGSPETGETLADQLPAAGDDQERALAHVEVETAFRHIVRAALSKLGDRERYIVERRFLADPEEEHSLADIGRTMNISRERVRQLETRTKQKLRSLVAAARSPVVDDWLAQTLTVGRSRVAPA
jgi:RNA polymerase sigma-32 factor